MKQDSEISKIIGLKKYENPEEGFFDDFLSEFQQRQRQEIVQVSSRQLLFERVMEYFKSWNAPQCTAVATVLFLITVSFSYWLTAAQSETADVTTQAVKTEVNNNPILVENRFVEKVEDVKFVYLDLSREAQSYDVEF